MTIPEWIARPCKAPSQTHRESAAARQTQLTKPPGSLGRLEDVAVSLAALQHSDKPTADNAAILLFAGDHGITAQGISAFPSSVTVEMLRNFARGGAAISVLSRHLDAPLTVVDAGTCAETPVEGVVTDKPCNGTADFSQTAAMSDKHLAAAHEAGQRAVNASGHRDLLLFGEMGIGNTTSAAAIASVMLERSPEDLVGAGTGLDTEGQKRKAAVIGAALKRHDLMHPNVDAADTLRCVGGLEIAALIGGMIAAAQNGIPVLVDGFIVSVAALAATRLNPSARPWLLFSHRSHEQGHRIVLDALDAQPLLALDMRLGEGSGAAMALPLIRNACALHNEMATFAEAAVSDGS